MEQSKQREFFRLLDDQIKALGLDTRTQAGGGDPQIGDTLRVLLPVNDAGAPVLMEIMAVSLREDMDLIQYYTTIVMEIGSGYDALLEATPRLNFFCPVGSFGIVPDARQYYHKYGALVDPDSSAEALCAEALCVLETVYDVLSNHYPAILDLAKPRE